MEVSIDHGHDDVGGKNDKNKVTQRMEALKLGGVEI